MKYDEVRVMRLVQGSKPLLAKFRNMVVAKGDAFIQEAALREIFDTTIAGNKVLEGEYRQSGIVDRMTDTRSGFWASGIDMKPVMDKVRMELVSDWSFAEPDARKIVNTHFSQILSEYKQENMAEWRQAVEDGVSEEFLMGASGDLAEILSGYDPNVPPRTEKDVGVKPNRSDFKTFDEYQKARSEWQKAYNHRFEAGKKVAMSSGKYRWEIRTVSKEGMTVQLIFDLPARFIKWSELVKLIKYMYNKVSTDVRGMAQGGIPINISSVEQVEPEVVTEDNKLQIFTTVMVKWNAGVESPVYDDVEELMMEGGYL